MVKNKGKGGKTRRRGKNNDDEDELQYKGDCQEYARVLTMLGNGRLDAFCFDGVKRLCLIRGKMRKRVWIAAGDIILVSLRDFQDAKADVIARYSPEEARTLKAEGELPSNVQINDPDPREAVDARETAIEFVADSIEDQNIDNDDDMEPEDIDDL